MKLSNGKNVVETIREKCRVCFTCVRECPAKAIRIRDGQAEIMGARCIGCGNCVKVCSQKAKRVLSSLDNVRTILQSKDKKIAMVAPSFPAEFHDVDHKRMVGALKKLGFDHVHEVGFGADLVSLAYKKLLVSNPDKSYIATTCPSIVAYVEKYYPELVPHLAPIVSPMIATARVLRKLYGKKAKLVFIGPCVAKKGEKEKKGYDGEIDEVMTFVELRDFFDSLGIDRYNCGEADFDEPSASKGALYAVSRGLLQSADIKEDLVEGNVVVADGRVNFVDAIKEFEKESLSTSLLETLCCEGCVMGAGINNFIPMYKRRNKVSVYVNEKIKKLDKEKWSKDIKKYSNIDLSCEFEPNDQRIVPPSDDKIDEILERMGKHSKEDELNCGACGYESCREHASAIFHGTAESEMCLPYTIEKLKETVTSLERSFSEIKSVKEALDHRDKLASMGQLAAGIAHEINNPLGIILMYAHILKEQCQTSEGMKDDIQMIVEQADRCKKIVSELLDFARQNRVVKTPVDISELVQRCIEMLNIPKDIEINIINKLEDDPMVELDRDQFSQVLINLINNAVDAIEETKKETCNKLKITFTGDKNMFSIIIEDTGAGISPKYIERIFDPFFTTKQFGKGTGLGLPVSYGIIKMHSGDIKVESNGDPSKGPTWTKVIVNIPRYDTREKIV
jgi:iron only hydrogenase large subunit-like protein/nitrogen-specific signal transduction histidine kinase